MTRFTLLAATALSAVAFAGAAFAGPITSASINGVTLDTRPATGTGIYADAGDVTSYILATEAVQPAGAANFTGPMVATLGVTGTSVANFASISLDAGQYDLVFTLGGAGTPTFATAVSAADITSNSTAASACLTGTTYSVIGGGGAGQASVTIRATLPAGCTGADRPSAFTLTKPITLASAGAATISATIGNVTGQAGTLLRGTVGTPAAGTTTAQAATLVNTSSIYDTAITADTAASTLALAGTNPYSALAAGSDLVIGSVQVRRRTVTAGNAAAGGAIFAGLNGEALPAYTYDARINATTGNFGLLNANIGGVPTSNVTGSGTSPNFTQVERTGIAFGAAAAPALSVDLVLDNAGATIANVTQDYTLAVTPSFGAVAANARFTTLPSISTTSLQSLSVQGTTFVAPWMGFSDTFNNVLRVSNSASTATGPVTLAITSPVTGSAASPTTAAVTRTICTSADLSKLANIPANGEINITSADLRTCFGTAPARGDVRVTIQASSSALSAKLRIVNPGSVVTEQSLGAISQGVATTN